VAGDRVAVMSLYLVSGFVKFVVYMDRGRVGYDLVGNRYIREKEVIIILFL